MGSSDQRGMPTSISATARCPYRPRKPASPDCTTAGSSPARKRRASSGAADTVPSNGGGGSAVVRGWLWRAATARGPSRWSRCWAVRAAPAAGAPGAGCPGPAAFRRGASRRKAQRRQRQDGGHHREELLPEDAFGVVQPLRRGGAGRARTRAALKSLAEPFHAGAARLPGRNRARSSDSGTLACAATGTTCRSRPPGRPAGDGEPGIREHPPQHGGGAGLHDVEDAGHDPTAHGAAHHGGQVEEDALPASA